MNALECWIALASTYSYVGAMRVENAASAAGRSIVWRIFLLGPIFQAQFGTSDSPFNVHPARGAYMWRDMERLCEKHGLPFRRPSLFPRNALLATRVALLGEAEPWIGTFVRAILRANFAEDRDISRAEVVREVLESLHIDPAPLVAEAVEETTKQRLRARTDEAVRRGIFGAPSFFSGSELFFGQDQLADAVAWEGGP